jgi:hypothetical protein
MLRGGDRFYAMLAWLCWRAAIVGRPTVPTEYEPLILDLVEWVARRPRPYAEVMEAWRTSCPRLPVWEDAVERGLVERRAETSDALVRVTTAGLAYLERHGRRPRRAG